MTARPIDLDNHYETSTERKRYRPTDRSTQMDTRSKILNPAKVLKHLAGPGESRFVIARGTFDILRAEHCRRLAQAKEGPEKLVVLIAGDETPRRTVLDARTRAELIAAVQVVDYVVICDEAEANGFISSLSPTRVVEPESPPLRDIAADVLRRSRSD